MCLYLRTKSATCSPVSVRANIQGIALLLVVVLASCGRLPAQKAPLRVVASIAPLADWAQKVGGARVSVQLIVPPGVDPRDYRVSSQQQDAILQADVVLMNGLGLEPWLEDILEDAPSSRLIVVEMSQFSGPLTERVRRKRVIEPDQSVTGPRSGTSNQAWEQAPIYSPYLWLDVNSARAQVGVIAQMLTRADPDAIVDFRQNAARYAGELENLDVSLFRQIDNWRWRTVVSRTRFLFPFTNQHGLSISIFGQPLRRGGPPLAQPLFVDAFDGSDLSVEPRGRPMVRLNPLAKSDYIDLMRTIVQSMSTTMVGHEE